MWITDGEWGLKFLVRLPSVAMAETIGRESSPSPPSVSRLEVCPHAASATGVAPSAVSLYRSRRLRCIVALLVHAPARARVDRSAVPVGPAGSRAARTVGL